MIKLTSGHKFLPMLDGWMKTAEGNDGWTASFFNEDPKTCAPIEVTTLPGSRLRINDEKPAGLADEFYLRLETYLVAPSTGTYDIGICVAGGRAALSVDGHEVVDNGYRKKQTPGSSFYGVGTIEETGPFDFVEGERYKIEMWEKPLRESPC